MDLYKLGKKFQADLVAGEKAALVKTGAIFASIDAKLEAELKKLETSPWDEKTAAKFIRLSAVRESLKKELEKIKHLGPILGPQIYQSAATLATEHVKEAAVDQLGPEKASAVDVKAAQDSPGANLATSASLISTPAIEELFSSVAAQAVAELESAIGYTMAAGNGPHALAREIRKISHVSKTRAATIARTETLRTYRETSRKIYEQNADLVKGYIWVARTTARTCVVCWAMHGTFHKLEKPFGSHPNCRCVMVPFLGGKNPVTLGPTVFKNLPEDKKLAVLGPGKKALYDAGVPLKYAVGYKQHPNWGPVRYERPIAEMASKVAIPGALGEDKLPAGTHAAAVAAAKAKLQAQANPIVNPVLPADDPPIDVSKIDFDHTPATPKPVPAIVVEPDPNSLDPIDAKRTGGKKAAAAGKKGDLVVQAPAGSYEVGHKLTVKTPAGNIKDVQVVKVGKEFPVKGVATQYHYVKAVAGSSPTPIAPDPLATPRPAAKTYVVDKDKKFEPAKPVAPKHPPDMDHAALKAAELIDTGTPWGTDHAGGFGGVVFDDDGRVLLRRNKGDYQGIRWTFAKVNSTAKGAVDETLDAIKSKQGIDGQITGFVPGSYKGGVRYFMLRSKDGAIGPTDANTVEQKWLTLDEAKLHIAESTDEAGKARDVAVLEAAFKERADLLSGKKDQWTPPPPPPQPPPPEPAPWEKPPVKAAKYKWPDRPAHFPGDPSELEIVSALGGSTGAKLVRDPKTGKKYVLKKGNNADHVREEFVADEIYRSLGVAVPQAHLYETKGGPVKLAEHIEGQTLDKVTGPAREKAFKELQEHFAVDAMLGNYDVVGMSLDNVLVDAKGKVWRIDNGGSLTHRAQGAKKSRWDEHVSTLWTMRGKTVLADDQTQAAATSVFKDAGIYKIRRQIDAIDEAAEKKMLERIPDELRAVVQLRLRTVRDIARHAEALEADDWTEDYADDVLRHIVGLREANVTHTLPKQLKPKPNEKWNATALYDENGRKSDHFTGDKPDSLVVKLEEYMKRQGTTIDIVAEWQSAQAGHSWSSRVNEFKHFLSDVVKLKKGEEYWHRNSKSEGKKLFEARGTAKVKYREAMAIQKATMLEILSRVDLPHVDRAKGTIRLIRTENAAILPSYGITPKQYGDNLEIKRGLSESYSLLESVTVHGHEHTVQELPITRVHGAYFMARNRHNSTAFLGDGENEVSALWRSSKDRTNYVPKHKIK